MKKAALEKYRGELAAIREAGTYKDERFITTPQRARIDTTKAEGVLNMCANNYLGLSNHPVLIEAAKQSYDKWGYGMSSVRFICGTQAQHKELEEKLAAFSGMEDCILYSSCFDANGGLFETLLGPEDAVVSDELNHASIIDGIRLCKAKRYRYKNSDMEDLRSKLEEAKAAGSKVIMIATDGVFSMDGYIANLKGICDIAEEYGALVMVDDSHAAGFMGAHGRGTPEHCGVMGRVDIITGTLGKALGGASGGYTCAHKEIVDILRQRSRPYLFSNTLAPAITAAAIATIDMLEASTQLRDKVHENARYFRQEMEKCGFDLLPGEHPIVPVMLYDAKLANEFARRSIAGKQAELEELENRYAWMKNLADTAGGSLAGKEKIMLETYIQATFFDRILRRANLRLAKMSGGQYDLKRRSGAANMRGQSGLELDIVDHINATERSVNTLSGGEAFLASLALALGLSDEVQMSTGIRLDTLFVDEGFGSLDSEALGKAYATLAGLTEGNRLVGIISHVTELKERIDRQIVVTKEKTGGSTARIQV